MNNTNTNAFHFKQTFEITNSNCIKLFKQIKHNKQLNPNGSYVASYKI